MRALLAVLLVAVACTNPPAPPPPPMETTAPVTTVSPRIVLPDGFVVKVEVVADNESRAQGLMFRDHLDPDRGMLFVFARDAEYSFWMKNTLIPLDMIWVDANRRVVGLIPDVPPCKIEDCPSYGPGVVARYVLELGGGEAAKHNLKVGDALQFIDIDVEAR